MTVSGEPPAAALAEFFGAAWPAVAAFEERLRAEGELRGLIGPRELPRLWTRHILNSAALAPFLPDHGAVADIGSGAGLPGVVLASMRPELTVHLVEPMQRRAAWLGDVTEHLALENVVIHQARAQDLKGTLHVEAATARAVADVGRLATMSVPLLRRGGRLVVLKGRRAGEEIDRAADALRRARARVVGVHEVDVMALGDPTTVVEIVKD